MNEALIVVDMQNDFLLNTGSLNLGHDTKELRENVAKFVSGFDGRIFLTADNHKEDDCEFKTFPKHCIENTEGLELVDELKEVLEGKDFQVLAKKSFTGGAILNLADELAERGTKDIHVVGVCTHICVHDVVGSIVNHTKNKYGYIPSITVYNDLVDDFDPEMEHFSLKRMQNLYGVKVL